jgi:hypothetical protein
METGPPVEIVPRDSIQTILCGFLVVNEEKCFGDRKFSGLVLVN